MFHMTKKLGLAVLEGEFQEYVSRVRYKCILWIININNNMFNFHCNELTSLYTVTLQNSDMFARMWSSPKKIETAVGRGIGMYMKYWLMVIAVQIWSFYKVMIAMLFSLWWALTFKGGQDSLWKWCYSCYIWTRAGFDSFGGWISGVCFQIIQL